MKRAYGAVVLLLLAGGMVWGGRPDGMGGVFIDRSRGGVTDLPGAVVNGSVTIIRIGACYSMSTIDSTSHDNQDMVAGETRWLSYIIQNQGNRRDSISFEAFLPDGRTVTPEFALAGPDSMAQGSQYGVWLEPGKICTVLARIRIPAENVYTDGDTLQFKIDIKNQHGTGGGADSTDGWPGTRTVYRKMALFGHGPEKMLTDKTALTGSQDWMVDRFAVHVTGGKKTAPQVPQPETAPDVPTAAVTEIVTGPHPFADVFTVHCRLAEKGYLFAGIFDLAGNPVKILTDGEAAGGERALTWDGTAGTGERVRHGLYFLKVSAGSVNRSEVIMYVH